MSSIQRFRIIAVVLVLTAIAAAQADSAQMPQTVAEHQSLTGTVKCAAQVSGQYKCGRNQTLLTCTLACAAQGSSFVLQTDNKIYFLTGYERTFEQLAGSKAILTGQIIGSTFAVNAGSEHIVGDSSPVSAGK
jgi:uncharacterized low-complexity protein